MIECKVEMKAYCDGCGVLMEEATVYRAGDVGRQSDLWKSRWKYMKHLILEVKFGPDKIYCLDCTPREKEKLEAAKAAKINPPAV